MPPTAPRAGPSRGALWTGLLAAAVFGTSTVANAPHVLGVSGLYHVLPPYRPWDSNQTDHLGGENLCIAKSIVAGRGFADPFGEPTGPTAWMPPVLPALQAVLLAALGGTGPASVAVAVLQNLALIYSGALVLRAAGRSRLRWSRPVALLIFLGGTWYHFHSCYLFTHDSWLVMAWVTALADAADRLWGRAAGTRVAAAWGATGGAAALSAPVLGPVWAALTALLATARRPVRSDLAAAALGVAAVLGPWAVRNYAVFHRVVPVKSNLPFELYQSNVLEPDGVLRFETGVSHPYRGNGSERARYRSEGEMRYLDGYRARFLRALADDPLGYLGRVGNRLLAATLVYFPFTNDEEGWPLVLSYLLHPLPFYGLVMTVLARGWRNERLKVIAVVTAVTYLAPYVLVAYYERYALPLLGVQALFVFWGWEAACTRLPRGHRPSAPVGV